MLGFCLQLRSDEELAFNGVLHCCEYFYLRFAAFLSLRRYKKYSKHFLINVFLKESPERWVLMLVS